MADNLKKQVIISVGADTQQAGQAVDQLQSKFNGLSNTQLDKPFKGFKTEIKEATIEAQRLEVQYGKASQQFINAAQKVAALKDQFGEFQNSISNFSPDNKLQPLVSIGSAAIKTVQGVTAGINLLGLQSGTAEAAIQKLTAIMAFSDVLNSLDDIKNGFNDMLNVSKNAFKSMSKGDLIGVAIIGITALSVAIYEAVTSTKELTEEQKKYNQVAQIALEKNGDQIAQLQILIDKVKAGGLSQIEKTKTLNSYNETLGKTLGQYKTYQQLEEALIKNGPRYIQYLTAKGEAEAAYGLQVEAQKELLLAQQMDAKKFTGKTVFGYFFDDETTYQNDKKKAIDKLEKRVNDWSVIGKASKDKMDALQVDLKIPVPDPTPNPTTGSKGNKTEDKSLSRDVVRKTGNLPKLSDDAKTWEEISLKAEDSLNQKMLQKKYAYSAEVTNIEKGNLANTEQLSQLRYQTEENTTNGLIKLDKTRLESNQALIGGISSGLQGLSQLAKKDSVAAKSLAAAGALIDTYAAITGILKSTAKTAAGGIPGYAIAQAVATGIFGMVQVRNILKTNVDGKGTGGDTSSISAPSLATAPVINASAAQQQSIQDVRVTNQNQAPVRAYIVNSDLVNNEQKNKFLNQISTF